MTDQPNPIEGAPKYFKRVYDRRGKHFSRRSKSVVFIDPIAGQRIVIYGMGMQSPYSEDKRVEKEMWDHRKDFLAKCFSPLAPEGELGFTPLSEVEEITQEEFEHAQREGWPQ